MSEARLRRVYERTGQRRPFEEAMLFGAMAICLKVAALRELARSRGRRRGR